MLQEYCCAVYTRCAARTIWSCAARLHSSISSEYINTYCPVPFMCPLSPLSTLVLITFRLQRVVDTLHYGSPHYDPSFHTLLVFGFTTYWFLTLHYSSLHYDGGLFTLWFLALWFQVPYITSLWTLYIMIPCIMVPGSVPYKSLDSLHYDSLHKGPLHYVSLH